MLIEVSKEKQDVTDKLLTNLFDETMPLKEYAENFEPSEAFMLALDEYIDYYNNKRIKSRLKGKSPVKYRTLSHIG